MLKKFRLFHVMLFLFIILALVGVTTKTSPVLVNAQDLGVTPTLYCLGACPTAPISGTVTGVPSISSAPSSIVSTLPSTVTSITQTQPSPTAISVATPTPTSPCKTTNIASLTSIQSPSSHGHHRGGFLSFFFELFLLLLFLLLGQGGLPCPTSTVPFPSLAATQPSTAQPSVALPSASQPSVAQPSTVAPTTGTNQPTTAAPTTAPITTNLTPDLSTNWAGYVFATAITANSNISADWTVTAIDCSTGDGSLSPWPGMGGWGQNDPNIAQLGNDMQCNSGTASYPAWSEAYPADSVYYDNPMDAGDQMTASVTFTGNGAFTTTMTNKTKGWTINAPMSFEASYVPQGGEVIFEAMGSSDPRFVPKFDTLTFINSSFSLGGPQTPLASAPGLGMIDLAGQDNVIQIQTGQLTGGTFNETWVHN